MMLSIMVHNLIAKQNKNSNDTRVSENPVFFSIQQEEIKYTSDWKLTYLYKIK